MDLVFLRSARSHRVYQRWGESGDQSDVSSTHFADGVGFDESGKLHLRDSLLFGFMLVAGQPFSWSLLFLPVVMLIELIFLGGLAMAFSAINVHYRDVQHILGNLMTLWFFLCPIVYPAANVPERFRITLLLNPVAVFTEMYHGMLLDGVLPSATRIIVSLLVALITWTVGCQIFNRYRESFAELV